LDLILDNRSAVFEPPRRLLELLDKRTAFYVKGFYHSPAFKARHWDGKEHLVKRFKPHSRKFKGWYVAPSGLLGEILAIADALGVEVTIRDERRRPATDRVRTNWNRAYDLRDYQERVIDQALADRGPATGKVLIEMPTRSGKTVVAAGIIHRLALRTLFLVQSELLLRQTLDAFRTILGVPIGRVGAGVWDPASITVASIQTLTRRAEQDECRELLSSFDCVIFDECFAAGTPVQTPAGPVPIEQIRVGDEVITFDPEADAFRVERVTEIMVRVSSDLFRVVIDGEEFIVTGGHPWFSLDDGWLNSASLARKLLEEGPDAVRVRVWDRNPFGGFPREAEVICERAWNEGREEAGRHDLYDVRYRCDRLGGDCTESLENCQAGVLFVGVPRREPFSDIVGDDGRDESPICLGSDAGAQSDAVRGDPRQGLPAAPGGGASSTDPGRKRVGLDRTPADASGSPGGTLGGRVGDRCSPLVARDAEELQTGLGTRGDEGGDRGGRPVAFHPEAAGTRPTEGCVSGLDRVDGHPVLQRGRVEFVGRLPGSCPVYNFGVSGTHTYVVGRVGAVVHNCHHVCGERWRDLLMEIDAFWKIGLSATIFLHEKKENPTGTIWVRAALGPVAAKITTKELIEQGQLLAPTVYVHPIRDPVVFADEWAGVYHHGIEVHQVRNAKIVEIALQRDAQGLQIVVVTRTHAHTEILERMLVAEGLRVGTIIGPTPAGRRQRLIKLFKAGELDVLLGTVLGEGVNIPEIGSVIVAEGGTSEVRGLQRFRCLTPSPGKDRATLDDFADMHHRILAKHSLARFRLYRKQGGFNLKDASRDQV
jgi:superfamily II DNA or RNA helicase